MRQVTPAPVDANDAASAFDVLPAWSEPTTGAQILREPQANEAIAAAGLADKVSVRLQDVATLPLHEATVIYMWV